MNTFSLNGLYEKDENCLLLLVFAYSFIIYMQAERSIMKELLYDVIKHIIKEKFIEEYPEIKDNQILLNKAVENCRDSIAEDDEFEDALNKAIYYAMDSAKANIVEPAIHTSISADSVILHYDDVRHIEAHFEDRNKPYIVYNDCKFSLEWLKNIDPIRDSDDIIEQLSYLMEELPRGEKIPYPYVQIWHKLQEWKREGYTENDLQKLESLLEKGIGSIESDEITQEVVNAFYNRMSVYSFRNIWPNHIEKVDDFDGKVDLVRDKYVPKKLNAVISGIITLSLYDSKKCKVEIEGEIRERSFCINGVKGYYWSIYHYQAVGKGFPMFSERDNKKISDFLDKKFPCSDYNKKEAFQ